MQYWLALLAGSLIFGACIVAAMVLPRHYATIATLLGIGGFVGSLYTLGTIAQQYSTTAAIGAAVFIVAAGIVLGYTISASSIPHLAAVRRDPSTPAPSRPPRSAVILLGSAEPERYDPRAVSHRQNLLAESADIEFPLTATPFLFLTEKTRYRAIGGKAPGDSSAMKLAEKVATAWDPDERPTVALASSLYPADLRAVVAEHVAAGVERVAVVSLGPSESAAIDQSLALLTSGDDRMLASRVTVAPTIWNDSLLVSRLADRILSCSGDTPVEHIGVALVCPGSPDAWERRYAGASEDENYFIQRVRVRLTEAGLRCDLIRTAWLEWQTPDVTETVRHLAVLGCQRIICVPATSVLPTLTTLFDLERATIYARVPTAVTVVTLGAWGDDDALAYAVQSAASSVLGDRTSEGSEAP